MEDFNGVKVSKFDGWFLRVWERLPLKAFSRYTTIVLIQTNLFVWNYSSS